MEVFEPMEVVRTRVIPCYKHPFLKHPSPHGYQNAEIIVSWDMIHMMVYVTFKNMILRCVWMLQTPQMYIFRP